MIIEEVYISQFGPWEQQHFYFSKQWTHIQGANESGKTTLFDFIFALLFGFRKISQKRKLQADAGGYLIVDCQGQRYQIERYLHQQRGRATVITLPERAIVGHDDFLAQLLPFTEKEAEAIYMMDSFRLQAQEIKEEEWQTYVLSYAVSGSDALFRLEKKYQQALKPYYKKRSQAGRIQQSLQEIAQLERKIAHLEAKEQDQSRLRYTQIKTEIARLEADLAKNAKQKQKKLLQESIAPYLPYQHLIEQLQHLCHSYQTLQQGTTLDSATYQALVQKYQQMKQQRRQYMQLQKKEAFLTRLVGQWQAYDTKIKKHYFLGGSVAVLGVACLAWVLYHPALLSFLALGACCLCFIFIVSRQKRLLVDFKAFKQKISEILKQKITKLEQIKRFRVSVQKRCVALVDFSTFEAYISLDGLTFKEKMQKIYQFLYQEKQKIQQAESTQQQKIAKKIEKYMKEIPVLTFENIKQTTVLCESVLKQIEDAQQDIQNIEQEIAQIPTDFNEEIWEYKITKLKEEKAQLEEQYQKEPIANSMLYYQKLCQKKQELQEQLVTYQKLKLKLNFLKDMKENLEGNRLQLVLSRASQFLQTLVGRTVHFCFQNQQLYIEELDTKKALTQLSTGFRQQSLLALRLAFISTQNQAFPVLMDEVWVFYDEQRRAALFQLLDRFSQNHQLISFASDDYPCPCTQKIDLDEERGK